MGSNFVSKRKEREGGTSKLVQIPQIISSITPSKRKFYKFLSQDIKMFRIFGVWTIQLFIMDRVGILMESLLFITSFHESNSPDRL